MRSEKEYLQGNNIFFLLFDKEGVKFLELVLQQLNEIDLRRGHALLISVSVRTISGGINPWTLRGPVTAFGLDELQALLELLVGQELVPPFRQGFLDLAAQALTELHLEFEILFVRIER